MAKSCVNMLVILMIMSLLNGCAYINNRANDALDILDVGVTVTKEPKFALYAGFNGLVNLGYADVDGKLYGLGRRQFGTLNFRQQSWGVGLYGQEHYDYNYDPENVDPASESPPEKYDVGLAGVSLNPPPIKDFFWCPKGLHLGWVGLQLNCKPGEIVDFIVGFTTIDLFEDDTFQ